MTSFESTWHAAELRWVVEKSNLFNRSMNCAHLRLRQRKLSGDGTPRTAAQILRKHSRKGIECLGRTVADLKSKAEARRLGRPATCSRDSGALRMEHK